MYKRGFTFKNIILGSKNGSVSYSNNTPVSNKIEINKVLVVTKLSRYGYEKLKHSDLKESDLSEALRKRGVNVEKLLHYHNLHKQFEDRMVNTLKDLGIEVQVADKSTYTGSDVQWADVVMSTGGDGTFLVAASKVHDNTKPVIGFNSDPIRSEGYLCLPKRCSVHIKEAIERLRQGRFEWLMRDRIRTTLSGKIECLNPKHLYDSDKKCASIVDLMKSVEALKTKDGQVLPVLALNEVFIGESFSARASHLEVQIDGGIITSVKCSGICVSTGTGSSSWHHSMNRISTQTVLEIFDILNYEPQMDRARAATLVAKAYNKYLIFPADSGKMAYTIRDIISAGVWPNPKGIRAKDEATQMYVKSNCFDATLVLDGGVSFAFPDGVVAKLEIRPEDALRTVVFST